MGFTVLFCSMLIFVALLKDDVFLTCLLICFVSLLFLLYKKYSIKQENVAKKRNFKGTG